MGHVMSKGVFEYYADSEDLEHSANMPSLIKVLSVCIQNHKILQEVSVNRLCKQAYVINTQYPIIYGVNMDVHYWALSEFLSPHFSNGDIVNASICLSIHPSRFLLLNHWVEFNPNLLHDFPMW